MQMTGGLWNPATRPRYARRGAPRSASPRSPRRRSRACASTWSAARTTLRPTLTATLSLVNGVRHRHPAHRNRSAVARRRDSVRHDAALGSASRRARAERHRRCSRRATDGARRTRTHRGASRWTAASSSTCRRRRSACASRCRPFSSRRKPHDDASTYLAAADVPLSSSRLDVRASRGLLVQPHRACAGERTTFSRTSRYRQLDLSAGVARNVCVRQQRAGAGGSAAVCTMRATPRDRSRGRRRRARRQLSDSCSRE